MKRQPPTAAVATRPAPTAISVPVGPIDPPRPPAAPRARITVNEAVAVRELSLHRTVRW
ncbi:hypothetical protein QFZ82_001313 [Streptomyces sp. V4I23]|nr:hypothetical protein [Streptomyces sp. V4I23]